MSSREEKATLQEQTNRTEDVSSEWTDLLTAFSGPAVVVETAEAPRFRVTWKPGEKQRLIEYFIEAAKTTLEDQKEIDETPRAKPAPSHSRRLGQETP